MRTEGCRQQAAGHREARTQHGQTRTKAAIVCGGSPEGATKAAFGAACGRREHRPEAASTVPRLETHRSCSSSRALCRSDSARCRRGCGVAETLGIASGGGVVPAA